ncbi:MAG: family 78 glycoside hydrolase catalytic domain [Sedimentisphaerales bacterium]|nr:family 78 glycoside hydrolase catalytic domain [Sedimentisphaerales bacterium]
MRTRTFILWVTISFVGSFYCADAKAFLPWLFQSGGLTVDNLRCEYRVHPLGIGTPEPRLSWTVTSKRRGQAQTAYQILVASSARSLASGTADLWDSGIVTSDQTTQVVYGGDPLTSGVQCFWKVRVWDQDRRGSSWSKTASWTMSLLNQDEWKAQWIGFDASRRRSPVQTAVDLSRASWVWYPEGDPKTSAPVATRYFRKTFTLPGARRVESAVCAATADNSFKLYVNGVQVGEGTNFQQASVVDVKEHLRVGRNVLALEASNVGDAANPAGVLAILRLRFAGGQPSVVASDPTWLASQSGAPGWTDVEFSARDWRPVMVLGLHGTSPWGRVDVGSGQLFLPPAQFLRKQFVLDKPIKRATLLASALGNYELHLNGKQVGDAYFAPGWTDYRIRVYYNTYDVTQQLRKGSNVLGAILADGWYSGHIGWGRKRDHYGRDPRFAAQLHVEFTDGSSGLLTTDGTWKAATGPILEADFLMGETYDAREEIAGWSTTSLDDADWSPVDVTARIEALIEPHPGVPVEQFQTIRPVGVTEPAPGTFVFDMGTNFAGFVKLKVAGAREGQKVVLRFAERLNPDGTIYTTNLRGARTTDTYICKGTARETWQPRFTFHGFQYVEVTGYPGTPGLGAITGVELTSATPPVGDFECSDETANTLYHNICQTQRANFIEVPTDCPQRDERLGWMGDAQIYVRTATYNADVAAFFTKWLVDVEDAQLPNGAFTDVSPRIVAEGGGTAAWGDAGVICPWTIYQVYGDKRVLSEHYDAMTKWIDYCKATTETQDVASLLRPAQGYGDWLSIQADTPKDVLATAYFAYSTKLVAQTAEVLDRQADAIKYRKLFADIQKAFNDAYVAADGRIKGDTQTVYVLALAFDLLPPERREQAVQYLVNDIRHRNWHLSTGFVGTKDLMTTLTRFGRTEVAYNLFHNDTFPSWGFSIAQGATSIWERWDGWTPEKGFQDPGMNSFAHYSFGAVGEWMFKTIGGIDTQGPGYKHLIIRPCPDGRLSWAKVSYDSIHGPIAAAWRIENRRQSTGWDLLHLDSSSDRIPTLILDVTIPANTDATVYIPTRDPRRVTESGKLASQVQAVTFIGTEGDKAVYRIGSGHYKFTAPLP